MKRNQLFFLCLFFAFSSIYAQVEVAVTVLGGASTSTCTDFFGSNDPLWRVNIGQTGWVTYPTKGSCFTRFPNEQYLTRYDCSGLVPADLEVCFSAFENDALAFEVGLTCEEEYSCLETICQTFAIPAPGDSTEYTLSLPLGGRSEGTVTFRISARSMGGMNNDEVCQAIEMGVLEFGQTLGDAGRGLFSNFCGTITNDVNPFDQGGWVNDAGVWFTFTTGNDPARYLLIDAVNDPENSGDEIDLELAVFATDNGACDGTLTLLNYRFDDSRLDCQVDLICTQPNTRYFVLVDGGPALGLDRRGNFGLQIRDLGVVEGPDDRCNAEDLGAVPANGWVSTQGRRSNFCATNTRDPFVQSFVSQNSVWFKFKAPPSGHIRIEGQADTTTVPLGVQLALYRNSSGNCNAFFTHLSSVYTFEDLNETLNQKCLYPGEELYILVDGDGGNTRGVFSLTIYDAGDITPVFSQDISICAGQSFQAGRSVYTTTGTYRDTLRIFAGCDSVVVTNLTVLQTVQAAVNTIKPAVGAGARNGVAMVSATGGSGQYTYQWCNGVTTARNDQLAGGVECCVTVTDGMGCEDVVCFEAPLVLPLEVSLVGDTLSCFGDQNGTAAFSVREGQEPYSFNWFKRGTNVAGNGVIERAGDTIRLSGLSGGTYIIQIKDAYFESVVSADVVEPDRLSLNNLATQNPSCNGSCDGRITLAATGGTGAYQWTWSDPGQTGPEGAGLCAGTYLVSVEDEKGCSAGLAVALEDPPAFLAEAGEVQPVTCFEGSDGEIEVTTNGNPVAFSWQNGAASHLVSGLPAGAYSVTVTNEDGCEAFASVVLTQPAGRVEVGMETIQLITCADAGDGVLRAFASGPGNTFSYQWSNGVTGAENANLGPGNYQVTVANEKGCSAQLQVIMEAPLPIQASFSTRDINCLDPVNGGALRIESVSGGRPGYEYSLDGILFRKNALLDKLTEGDYLLTVRDATGCEEDYPFAINGPPELWVSLGGDRTVQLGETLRLKPQSNSMDLTILWDPLPEGVQQGAGELEVLLLEGRRFSVAVKDNTTFCTATDDILVQVDRQRKVYFPNVFNPEAGAEENRSFRLYGGLGIEQVKSLRIFDRNGGVVFAARDFLPDDPAFAWDGTRNGQGLASGVYVYAAEITFIDGETEVFAGEVVLLR